MTPPVLPLNIIRCMSKDDRNTLGKAGDLPEEINKKIKDRLEKDLHSEVSRYLKILGIPFVYSRTDKRSYLVPTGWADLTLCYKGMFVCIELKTGSKLSPEQQCCREEILRAGGRYLVARQTSEVKDFLREIDAELNPPPTI
jgi:hypothetical protein